MAVYRPSSVDVTVQTNPRIINVGETTRIPAIVGLGPTSRSVVDEAVQRGTGSTDLLSLYPITGVSVSQIANAPGVVAGALNAISISANGALYSSASASVGVAGSIAWPQGTLGVNVPATGSVYYVTYSANVPSSQYDPGTFSDKQTIRAKYGAEGISTGLLTVAGSLALENGAPGVLLVQASGSSYSEANYKLAIDKLQTKTNIEYVVCVFPSASVTRAQQETLMLYAYTHVLSMSQNKRERGLITGSPSTSFATDGYDSIGDANTTGTYLYRSAQLRNKNATFVVPSRAQRKDDSGNTMELDGNFMAAAIAGLHTGQAHLSTPIHGFTVLGFTITDEKWNEFEMNQLGAGNCLVLESRGGIVTVRDAITTDPTSADTAELSVVSQERLVKRTRREGLKNVYTNKGKVITATTVLDVEATTYSILSSMVKQGDLNAFGVNDNPATGEVQISAKQNTSEPRQVDVTCSVKYLYPLKFVSVTVSTYV